MLNLSDIISKILNVPMFVTVDLQTLCLSILTILLTVFHIRVSTSSSSLVITNKPQATENGRMTAML
jgi:hypothetical protein